MKNQINIINIVFLDNVIQKLKLLIVYIAFVGVSFYK